MVKMRRFGILCPEVVILKKNVLVMSFIGENGVPAPKLKEASLSETQLEVAYRQCCQVTSSFCVWQRIKTAETFFFHFLKILKDLYNECNLVHADFSEYNLLWFQEKVWVIDVSQSIENLDTMSLEYLYRDCKNLSKFFRARNLENVASAEELFKEITKKNFTGEGFEFQSQVSIILNSLSCQDSYNLHFSTDPNIHKKQTNGLDENYK